MSVINPVLANTTSLRCENVSRNLAADASIMLVFSLLAGGFNYLYQLSMGIYLPVEDYGTVFSLFSFFLIVWWFPQALQTPITKIVSGLKVVRNPGGITYVWRYSFSRMLLIGIAVFMICAALSSPISHALKIENNLYAILVFSSFIFTFLLPVNFGVLRGLQRFVALGFVSALWALLRFTLAGFFVVFLDMGIYGALLPLAIAPFLSVVISQYLLKDLIKEPSRKVDFGPKLKAYTGYSALALVGFAVATNIDVIIAKYFLTPADAGTYSALATLGRVVLIAPAGIVAAMFPKVAEKHEAGLDPIRYLKKSLLYVICIGGLPALVFLLFPGIFINFLLAGKYPIIHLDLVKYAAGMFFFSLSFVFLNYLVALGRTSKPALSFLLVTAGLVISMVIFHGGIGVLVNVIMITGFISLVILFALYMIYRKTMLLVKRSS